MDFFDIGVIVNLIIDSIPTSELPIHFKDKVFPLVTVPDTVFPFCTYRRTDGRYIYNDKDYDKEESVSIQLKVVTNKYEESIDLISKIANAFINFRNIFIARDNIELTKIDDIKLVGSNEEFYDDSYIQTIYLEFTYK